MGTSEHIKETVNKLQQLEAEQAVMEDLFNRSAYEEYVFRMEAYMSTLDPARKGSEVIKVAAMEARAMDEEEPRALETACWNW